MTRSFPFLPFVSRSSRPSPASPASAPDHLRPLHAADPDLVGPWRLLARLGAGGSGTVFLARPADGRGPTVALKIAHEPGRGDTEAAARFRNEVGAGRDLLRSETASRHVAALVDADPDGARPWLATEYLPAPTLREAVDGAGPWSPAAVLGLGADLVEALTAVHAAGPVHRDLKPSNVLITPDGPRLIDFGIALRRPEDHAEAGDEAPGSPGYAAPEQMEGGPGGPAGDVFSLGAVLVFAATGSGPFGTGAPRDLVFRARYGEPRPDGVGDGPARELSARCLDPDPARRPSLVELGRALKDGRPDHDPDNRPPPAVLEAIAARTARVAALEGPLRLAPPEPGPVAGVLPSRRGVLFLAAGTVAAATGTGAAGLFAGRAARAAGERSAGPVDEDGPVPPGTPGADGMAPTPRWEVAPGRTAGRRLVVAGDTLVLAPGIGPGTMTGLDTGDGATRWVLRGVSGTRPVPTPDGSTVIVRQVPGGGRDRIGLVDSRSGRLRASRPLGMDLLFMEESPVAACEGSTAFLVGHDPGTGDRDEATGAPRPVVAYDTETDEVVWRAEIPPVPGPAVEAVVSGGRLILLGADTIHALDPRDGRIVWERVLGENTLDSGEWSRRPETPPRRIAVAPDDGVVVTGRGVLHLDAPTGTTRWSLSPDTDPEFSRVAEDEGAMGTALFGAPVVEGNTLHLNILGSLRAVDVTTMEGLWSWHPEGEEERTVMPPAGPLVAAGLVFPPLEWGRYSAVALDAATGEPVWRVDDPWARLDREVAGDGENLYLLRDHMIRAFPLTG